MKERKNLYQFLLKPFPSPPPFFQPSCFNENGVESKLIVLQKDEEELGMLKLKRRTQKQKPPHVNLLLQFVAYYFSETNLGFSNKKKHI